MDIINDGRLKLIAWQVSKRVQLNSVPVFSMKDNDVLYTKKNRPLSLSKNLRKY